ncbi:MAG TPA: hypothetical protein VHR72_00750 [Gemmataceae bacterium]|jgi:hypothetical protein|nr:hypothetical protein [Gemmataceae bacterium]
MIENENEYRKAEEEIRQLEEWLGRLKREHPLGSKGLTKAGVRRRIARTQEELALFEATFPDIHSEAAHAVSTEETE